MIEFILGALLAIFGCGIILAVVLIRKAELEPPCALCGGPHTFDTSVQRDQWNKVIRAQGLPEYLCTTCIVREFAKAGESFSAKLWGDDFKGTAIRVDIDRQPGG